MNKLLLSLLTGSLLLLPAGCEDDPEPGERTDGDGVSVLDELNQRFESVKDKTADLLDKANSPETRQKIREAMDGARDDLEQARQRLAELKQEAEQEGSEVSREGIRAARQAVEDAEKAYRQAEQQAEEIIENQQGE